MKRFISTVSALLIMAVSSFADDSKFVDASKEISWSTTSPIDFINILKKYRYNVVVIDRANTPSSDWIKKEHVPTLMQLIYSVEPAAPVILKGYDNIPSEPSTVGREAMFLIEGYKRKQYPPGPSSVNAFTAKPLDYNQWWTSQVLQDEFKGTVGVGSPVISSNFPTTDEVLADSKPAELSIADALLLRHDFIIQGAAETKVLVGVISGNVEYVWSNVYRSYVRPKFVMQNAQALFNRSH